MSATWGESATSTHSSVIPKWTGDGNLVTNKLTKGDFYYLPQVVAEVTAPW